MSYILEALKKSELEREQLDMSVGDDVMTSQNLALAADPSSTNLVRSSLKAVYLSVVVILVSVLAYLLFKPVASVTLKPLALIDEQVVDVRLLAEAQSDNVTVASKVPSAALPMTEVSVVDVVPAKVEVAHVSEAKLVEEVTAIKEVVTKKEVVTEESLRVLSIEQANESLLAQIPNISITSHIYSSQAKRRSIVVNDERLVEGDFIAPKVQVKEITHQGMILEVDGSLLAVSRSRGWNR